MKRYGQLIQLPKENYERYKELHAAVWPKVLAKITECNIHNYSIFHKNEFLFAYFEYHGTDFEADMKKMAADPTTQEWWNLCCPLQKPLPNNQPNEWWANMEELFHWD